MMNCYGNVNWYGNTQVDGRTAAQLAAQLVAMSRDPASSNGIGKIIMVQEEQPWNCYGPLLKGELNYYGS